MKNEETPKKKKMEFTFDFDINASFASFLIVLAIVCSLLFWFGYYLGSVGK